ncbi:MAG: phospholipase D-like domain-containing protein [Thermomicrobiales bacterium]
MRLTRRRRRLLVIWLLVAVAIIGWAYALGALPSWTDNEPALAPTVVAGEGSVALFVEPEDGREPVLAEIRSATRTIDLEVYILTDDEIIAALEGAAARGVRVRVMIEQHPFGGGGDEPAVVARLQDAGIEVQWGPREFSFVHIKTMTVDNRTALIMNLNLSGNAFRANRDFGVITTEPAHVAQAAGIFDADWSGGEPPDGPLIVSPINSRSELLALIDSAQRSLDVYAEVVRDLEIVDALQGAVERGVTVRLIMSTETFESDPIRLELAAAGVEVRLVDNPYIHAKMLLADGQRAFVGSQNLTQTSLDENRELGLILTDPINIRRIQQIFDADFAIGVEEHAAVWGLTYERTPHAA